MKRHLTLKRENLTELSADDLLAVAGAAPPTTPVDYCLRNTQYVCYTEQANPSHCVCPTEA